MKLARDPGMDIVGRGPGDARAWGDASEPGRPASRGAGRVEDTARPVGRPRWGSPRSSRWLLPLAAVLLSLAVSLIVGSLALRQPGSTGGILSTESSSWPPASSSSLANMPTGVISDPEWARLLPQFEKATQANPEDRTAQQRLALAFFNLGRFEEAEAIYRRLLAKQEDAILWNRLGNVLRNKGDLVGAEAAYRRSIKENASLAAPYINLAELLWRQHREKDALDLLAAGKEKVPRSARASFDKVRDALQQTQQG